MLATLRLRESGVPRHDILGSLALYGNQSRRRKNLNSNGNHSFSGRGGQGEKEYVENYDSLKRREIQNENEASFQ